MKTVAPTTCDFFAGIEYIPDKNNGGCPFFCYVFWKWLKKHGLPTESFDIAQYDAYWDSGNAEHNLEWIEGKIDDDPRSSCHFTWLYGGIEYDGEGIVNHSMVNGNKRVVLSGLNTVVAPMVDKFCIEALNKAGWNNWFNRNDAIDTIANTLEIDMNEVAR